MFSLPNFHNIRHMKVVRLSASSTGRLYPQEIFVVLSFTRGQVDPSAMVRSEGNMSLKNPMTLPGIDPGTVRVVAQRLSHYINLPIKSITVDYSRLITALLSLLHHRLSADNSCRNKNFPLRKKGLSPPLAVLQRIIWAECPSETS
jgi:hypothetical protein